MRVVSFFDGCSCGRLALQRAGVPVTSYHAYEIDPSAILVSQWNWDDVQQMGSVIGADLDQHEGTDLLIGGSPCQGFSFAGKQLNFNDPRSALFFEFVNAKNRLNPRFFMLENVVMKQEYQDVITEMLGVEPILINSALVSAQNRRRLYWTNIPGVCQPEDRGVKFTDIIDESVRYPHGYLSDTMIDYLGREFGKKGAPRILNFEDKAGCITASSAKGPSGRRKDLILDKPAAIRGRSLNTATIVGRRPNDQGRREDYSKGIKTTQCLEVRGGEKMNCLTTVSKDTVVSALPIGRYPEAYKLLQEGYHWRYLTPIECERLQTLPDGYTECVCASQRMRMCGNGWTVDVIADIFSGLNADELL